MSDTSAPGSVPSPTPASPRLAVLKALGDNTRYAIYLELARSPQPLTTAEVADTLQLHPNTVRPHLERMREVGLLQVDSHARGTPGRPQHRYSVAPDAPSLGLEPPTFPILARMLLHLASSARLGEEDAVEAGRTQGEADALRSSSQVDRRNEGTATPSSRCLSSLVARLDELGFDPALVEDPSGTTTVAFLHCPFRELAEENSDVICGLHRGLVEGFVDSMGACEVNEFHPLLDRTPCQVSLSSDHAADELEPLG